jgi:hypothetical protein
MAGEARVLGDPPAEQTVRKVRQLIGEARTRPAGGIGAVLARRSWSRLARAYRWSGRERWLAYQAVLDDWAAAGTPDDDPRPELLASWGGGRRGFERHLMMLAQPPDHPQWAALAAYCVRHGILPRKPTDRVRLLALTGQAERRRALDPDGVLLARAYRTAHQQTRERLRAVLANEGDVDVARIVADTAGRAAARATGLATDEHAYLTGELAARRDWAGLWRLATSLPVLDAAGAARLIDPGWRLDAQRDRDLLARLARADPAALRDAGEALRFGGVLRVEVPGEVVAGTLSPDGRQLAVTARAPAPPAPAGAWSQGSISVYALPDGQLQRRYEVLLRDFAGLVFRGTALFAVDSATAAAAGPDFTRTRVYRFAGRFGTQVAGGDSSAAVAVAPRHRGFTTVSSDGTLAFYGRDGARFAGGPPGPAGGLVPGRAVMAAAPGGGYAAVADGTRVIVTDVRDPYQAKVVGRIEAAAPVTGLCPEDDGRVIIADHDGVWRWQAGSPPDDGPARGALRGGHSLVALAGRDDIGVLDGDGAVRYLDKRTLEAVTGPRELTGMSGTALWGQDGGPVHALAGDGAVHVALAPPGLRTLTTGAQAAWRPEDLATAPAVASIADRSPAARPLADLIAACLDHRFGSG